MEEGVWEHLFKTIFARLHFQLKMQQKSFCGRATPGPAGGLGEHKNPNTSKFMGELKLEL